MAEGCDGFHHVPREKSSLVKHTHMIARFVLTSSKMNDHIDGKTIIEQTSRTGDPVLVCEAHVRPFAEARAETAANRDLSEAARIRSAEVDEVETFDAAERRPLPSLTTVNPLTTPNGMNHWQT